MINSIITQCFYCGGSGDEYFDCGGSNACPCCSGAGNFIDSDKVWWREFSLIWALIGTAATLDMVYKNATYRKFPWDMYFE